MQVTSESLISVILLTVMAGLNILKEINQIYQQVSHVAFCGYLLDFRISTLKFQRNCWTKRFPKNVGLWYSQLCKNVSRNIIKSVVSPFVRSYKKASVYIYWTLLCECQVLLICYFRKTGNILLSFRKGYSLQKITNQLFPFRKKTIRNDKIFHFLFCNFIQCGWYNFIRFYNCEANLLFAICICYEQSVSENTYSFYKMVRFRYL